jgi:hypothetical protein
VPVFGGLSANPDEFGVNPDDRQVAIEFAKSHRVWWSILMMTWPHATTGL